MSSAAQRPQPERAPLIAHVFYAAALCYYAYAGWKTPKMWLVVAAMLVRLLAKPLSAQFAGITQLIPSCAPRCFVL